MITMSEPYGRQGKPQMIQYLPTFFSVIYSAVYFFPPWRREEGCSCVVFAAVGQKYLRIWTQRQRGS
ncbi:hypothetical protein CCUS01_11190 [Colletotrichum cuscutae]|uniref:Uncharacterized protein n=1 Tax=Colletotrichum cuscutae TaxID=1209917 RepID=A0AAI9U3V4_9PEZI|nr:hypothetical protein CCUS01_11190 [Colletotrichum cuscutae]